MNIILCPSYRLTKVVGSRGKAVVAAWKIGKFPHWPASVFPNKAEIDKASREGPTVEGRATPGFSQWFWIGSLRNTHDDALGILNVPCYTAIRSPKCEEVEQRTVSPQSSVPRLVSRQSGIACHPTLIVDAVSSATCPAQSRKAGHLVMGFMLCQDLVLRTCRP